MTNEEIDTMIRHTRQEISRMPICKPAAGEFVDECHFSKTGWAIWKMSDGITGNWCTCRPAKAPVSRT